MKKSNIFTIILIGLIIFIFHRVFSLTSLSANDFPYLSQSELSQRFSIPYAWWDRGSQGLGEYSIPFLWVWPMDFIYGLGANLGLSFAILERLFGIIPALVLGIYGIRKLLKKYDLQESSIFVGTLIFILNSYFLLLMDGGQLSFTLSYAWLPFVFLFFLKAYELKTRDSTLKAGLSLALLAMMDIRYVYLFGILILIYIFYHLLFEERKNYFKYIKRWSIVGGIAGIILVLLLSHMIVPIFLAQAAALPDTYGRVSQTDFLGFTTMANAILLLQPHWYKNVFGNLTPLIWYFAFFPIIAFAAPLLNKKNKNIGFWLLIALVGIFLTKGSLEPLGGVYTWLFIHIPGFSLFRDSSKFYVFITLSYAVLSAFTIEGLLKRKLNDKMIILILASYFLLLTYPVWSNKMTGVLSMNPNWDAFQNVEQTLSHNETFGRIVWIPGRTPLSYADMNHPSLEASRLLSMRPFAIGVVGSYEVFNFLRDSRFIDQILKVSGIKYIAYPYPDERRQELKPDERRYYDTFLHQLTNSSWSDGQITDKPYPVVKTRESSDHVFLAPNHYFILGSDAIYRDLSEVREFDLSKNALTFLEESKDYIDVSKFSESKIILYKKSVLDLVLNRISTDKFVFPAKQLQFDPDETGWWKRETSDLVSWRAFLQDKYGLDNLDFDYKGGWAIAEGGKELRIKNQELRQGNILFARVMKSSRGGKVEFWQGDSKVGEINTKDEDPEKEELIIHGYEDIPDTALNYDYANFSWNAVGALITDAPVVIKTEGDINVINVLTALSEDEFISLTKQTDELEREGRILYWDTLGAIEKENLFTPSAYGTLTYKRISPVEYKLTVSGMTHPQTVVLSESYNSMWQMNGQSSFSTYSMLNGFRIDQNGEYSIYFSAQKYVNYGLVISGITLSGLVYLLLKVRKKVDAKNKFSMKYWV